MPNLEMTAHSVGMTAANKREDELLLKLRDEVARLEKLSRRNGWDTERFGSVYPGGALVDTLLDLRGTLSMEANAAAVAIVEEALQEYGRRPGTCTTTEVGQLCDRLASAPANVPTMDEQP